MQYEDVIKVLSDRGHDIIFYDKGGFNNGTGKKVEGAQIVISKEENSIVQMLNIFSELGCKVHKICRCQKVDYSIIFSIEDIFLDIPPKIKSKCKRRRKPNGLKKETSL